MTATKDVKVNELNEISIEEALNLGVEAHKAGKIRDADRHYTAILKVQPKHPDANHNMGVLAVGIAKLEEGLQFFERALESNPSVGQFWASYVGVLLRLNRINDAEDAMHRAKNFVVFGDNLKLLEKELSGLSFDKRVLKSDNTKTYQKDGTVSSQLTDNDIKRLKNFIHQKRFQEALNFLDKLAYQFSDDVNFCNLQGIAYAGLKEYKNARKSYEKALTINDKFPELYYNLGIALRCSGETSGAIANLKAAVKLKPNYTDAYNNLGLCLHECGKLSAAIKVYEKLISIDKFSYSGFNNLGLAFLEIGKLDKAIVNFRSAIHLCEGFVEAHFNLGNAFYTSGDLDQAITCYQSSINLKPQSADLLCNIYFNMGIALVAQGKLNKAISSYEDAIKNNPNFHEAYYNMGNTLYDQGKIEKSIQAFSQSLKINPEYLPAWNNIAFPLVAGRRNLNDLSLLNSIDVQGLPSEYITALDSTLSYRCSLGTKAERTLFDNALAKVKKSACCFIENPTRFQEPLIERDLKDSMVALLHFGRSGTGLLHSLIDGHPEIITLPSIYFSEFFNQSNWQDLVSRGWEKLVDNFILKYDVLFDSRSDVPVLGKSQEFIRYIGKKEGMANLGADKDEFLRINRKHFKSDLRKLMSKYSGMNQLTFFRLVHLAYNKQISNINNRKLIFYHIHNPEALTKLNFISLCPDVKWVMMVREPIQCCESWISAPYENNDYKSIVYRIATLLCTVDDLIFSKKNAVGLRLEDLKLDPKGTMSKLCLWLNIEENPCLFEMTAQGKKWWGDPTSPDYGKDGMEPFGKISVTRKTGKILSDKDQFILNTIFYPFRSKFGYTNESNRHFINNLKKIKPMLDQLFDFEKELAKQSNISSKIFAQSGSYKYLRSVLMTRLRSVSLLNSGRNIIEPLSVK